VSPSKLHKTMLLVLVCVLAVSAGLKLVPRDTYEAGLGRPVLIALALAELLVALLIAVPRLRRIGIRAGLVFFCCAALYRTAELFDDSVPACGCFGGWVQLQVWQHLFVVGILITLTAKLAGAEDSRAAAA